MPEFGAEHAGAEALVVHLDFANACRLEQIVAVVHLTQSEWRVEVTAWPGR